ncbi:MAG: GNAT family N-acetyltransferase [Myxococcota bacterium]
MERLSPFELDAYLATGWFRIGQTLMTCRVVLFDGALRTALWTRLPLSGHKFRKSARKQLNRVRREFTVKVQHGPIIDQEHEALYQRYREVARGERSPTLDDFLYGDSEPLELFDTYETQVYHQGRLVAFSWFDLGHNSAQSLMGVYDPDYRKYGLGYATMLLEIEHAAALEKDWFYPGYVLPGEPAMDYKLRIGDVEYYDADTSEWQPWSEVGQHELAEAQLRRALREAANHLAARGVRVVMRMYPMFEAPAWHDQLVQCLEAPLVLVCDPRPLARRQVLVTYDLDHKQYEMLRCARASAMALTHDGDVGRPIELWLVEERIGRFDDVDSLSEAATQLRR